MHRANGAYEKLIAQTGGVKRENEYAASWFRRGTGYDKTNKIVRSIPVLTPTEAGDAAFGTEGLVLTLNDVDSACVPYISPIPPRLRTAYSASVPLYIYARAFGQGERVCVKNLV